MANKVDINQEIIKNIEDDMARQITQTSKCINDGWAAVHYPEGIGFIEHCEIKDWVEENIKGPNKLIHTTWWFKDPKDKVLFLLRWPCQ